MKKILFLLALLTTFTAQAQKVKEAKETDINLIKAALKGWHVRLGAGVSLGGTSPLPLPAEIRGINSYNPTLCVQLEGAVHRKFGKHWGTMIGVRFENKGMKTDATVKNYHMEAINDDGSGVVNGAWTGNVKTEVNNNYLTFPVLATYSFNDRWQVQAGTFHTSSMVPSQVRLTMATSAMVTLPDNMLKWEVPATTSLTICAAFSGACSWEVSSKLTNTSLFLLTLLGA